MLRRTLTVALLLSALLTAAAPATAQDPPGPGPHPFWVDPDSDAARQAALWERQGPTEDARTMRRIADQPTPVWLADADPTFGIERAVRAAAAADRTVLLVAYRIPHRDCGQYSAGGAESGPAYLRWIDRFARTVGDAKALVVLEPDAVPHLLDGCTPARHQEERYELLARAVDRLKRQPRTKVYLDAGHPAWVPEPWRMVPALMRSGVARADGFALNVSNFRADDEVIAYGDRFSELLGGKHYVVDTSRNGSGPPPAGTSEPWCNPPGRTLGRVPTTDTGHPRIDAFLWIKHPGDSDRACRGAPEAGEWWPQAALALARTPRP
ncbi:glycoside hydrolase family 6 protein [Streptomyces indicus]|uniref:Glucanase n=1 Tax=Streptomyces indicus TaxID=417292 RepID=A0A1G8Z5Y2_9ACTN|nr:glycoside hydrolase family 6 protein [Streptomyces indicus]SDK10489.1 endoglucanase [Streptomyces indicus]